MLSPSAVLSFCSCCTYFLSEITGCILLEDYLRVAVFFYYYYFFYLRQTQTGCSNISSLCFVCVCIFIIIRRFNTLNACTTSHRLKCRRWWLGGCVDVCHHIQTMTLVVIKYYTLKSVLCFLLFSLSV